MSTHKNQRRASSKATPHRPQNKLYLLRGDKLTDGLLGNVLDDLIAATAAGQAKSPPNNRSEKL